MSIGLLFWLLMVIWFVFGFYTNWPADGPGNAGFRGFVGNHLLVFILFFLLGWKVFGFVIQGP